MRRGRWIIGLFVLLISSLQTGSQAVSAEPIIPAPSRIVLSMPSTSAIVTSGTIVPTHRLIEELSTRCNPGGGTLNSWSFFDKQGEIDGYCEFDGGDDSFQRQFGTGWIEGNVNLETGAFTFKQTSSVTLSFLGTSNTYDVVVTGSATLPGGYFPAEGRADFTFSRVCAGPGCSQGDSSYSYAGTIGFEFNLFPIEEVDLVLHAMIAVQVVEEAEMIDASELEVADKATVVRVYVTAGEALGGVTVELTATRNGVPLGGQPTLLVDSARNSVITPNPNLGSDSFNFRLPANWTGEGTIQLEARAFPPLGVVDPVPENNVATVESVFVPRKRLSITYLPVCLANGQSEDCPAAGIASGAAQMNRVFPSPDPGAIYEPAMLPPWIWTAPLLTEDDGDRLLAALNTRYNLMTLLGVLPGPDQLAAWIPRVSFPELPLGMADAPFTGGAGRVTLSQFDASNPEDSYRTLTHEVSHNLGRRHPGTDDSCGSEDPDTDWPSATARIEAQGWNMEENIVVPSNKKDLMSYCAPPASNLWISPFTYSKLFDALAPTGSPTLRTLASYFVVSGTVKADGSGGTLNAGYAIQSNKPAGAASPNPTHCLRFNNSPANDWCLRLTFAGTESGEPMEERAFSIVAPMPASVTRVSLVRIDGNVELAAMNVSPSAPSVAIMSPGVGESWNHEQTVSWTVDDADGGTSTSSLLYSTDDGGTWLPLAVDMPGTSFTFDTDALHQGPIQFRVLSSDGINTADVTSPIVTLIGASGDVDCNGEVDGVDALETLRMVAGLDGDIDCGDAADVDCSGTVGLLDAVGVRRHVALLPVSLPQGCAAIGVD